MLHMSARVTAAWWLWVFFHNLAVTTVLTFTHYSPVMDQNTNRVSSTWLIRYRTSVLQSHNIQPVASGTICCVDTAGALNCPKVCPCNPNGTWHSAAINAPASTRPSVSVHLPYVRTVYELDGRFAVRQNAVCFQRRWRTVTKFSEPPSNWQTGRLHVNNAWSRPPASNRLTNGRGQKQRGDVITRSDYLRAGRI